MKLSELWDVSPTCHVFVRTRYGVTKYEGTDYVDLKGGERAFADSVVANIRIRKYPMFDNVLEVILKGDYWYDILHGREEL